METRIETNTTEAEAAYLAAFLPGIDLDLNFSTKVPDPSTPIPSPPPKPTPLYLDLARARHYIGIGRVSDALDTRKGQHPHWVLILCDPETLESTFYSVRQDRSSPGSSSSSSHNYNYTHSISPNQTLLDARLSMVHKLGSVSLETACHVTKTCQQVWAQRCHVYIYSVIQSLVTQWILQSGVDEWVRVMLLEEVKTANPTTQRCTFYSTKHDLGSNKYKLTKSSNESLLDARLSSVYKLGTISAEAAEDVSEVCVRMPGNRKYQRCHLYVFSVIKTLQERGLVEKNLMNRVKENRYRSAMRRANKRQLRARVGPLVWMDESIPKEERGEFLEDLDKAVEEAVATAFVDWSLKTAHRAADERGLSDLEYCRCFFN
ncbi:hypothetical protein BDW74DRAFT_179140 [Aspergillus multicolor]|uniref:uncharacterized protein n=1 Tax=Aspergillus multicolor TaxID=41759 RepID=UPI003CCCB7B4